MEIFSSFDCGDLQVLYLREGDVFDLAMIPAAMRDRVRTEGRHPESMVRFKPAGTPFGGTSGSMRNFPCLDELNFRSQKASDGKITTCFQYGDGLLLYHIAELHDGWVRIRLEAENQTSHELKLDQLSSFSLGMISPFENGKCFLERVTERWHHEELSMERAGMERPNCLRFGTGGSMPVEEYYPFAGIEDRANGVLWGVQLENSGPWMLEFASSGCAMSLSGGLPDRGFCGHGLAVPAGGLFRTPAAVLACVKGDILDLFNRLQKSQFPADPPELSGIYNGPFSEKTLSFLKASGIRYYVLEEGSDAKGLCEIAAAGLIPGVTLDMETAQAAEPPEGILTLDGAPLRTGNRVFIDYRDPGRRKTLLEKLCGELKEKHIGYVKLLSPAAFCCGCDGAGSPPESLREYTDSLFALYAELRRNLPGLFMEFCTRETGRFSPRWLTLADMMTGMAILPENAMTMAALDRQMLTPSFKSGIRTDLAGGGDLVGRLAASLVGRPVFAGDPAGWTGREQTVFREFLEFYREARPALQSGEYRLGHIIGDSCMVPSGWQVFYKNTPDMQLAVFHTFSGLEKPLLPDLVPGMKLRKAFSGGLPWNIRGGKLEIGPSKTPAGAAFLLIRE